MPKLNKYYRRCARRLAKERRHKPSIRPAGQKDKINWQWEECYDEIKAKKEA